MPRKESVAVSEDNDPIPMIYGNTLKDICQIMSELIDNYF